jgi:hypothetical protein
MAANTNSSTQPDPKTFDGSRRRRDNQFADTSTRRELTVRAVWPGDFPPAPVRSPPRPANTRPQDCPPARR